MKHLFPAEREAKRTALLRAVDGVRATLAAHADESEALRTLPDACVQALTDTGLFALKCPAQLGGAEADPATQLEVIEAATYIDPSAGWSLMIGSGSLAIIGAFLPDEAIAQMFTGDRPPRTAGALMPGKAVPVEGGYRVSGRWSWGSGVRHAEWVAAQTLVVSNDAGRPQPRMVVFPAAQAEIDDNWHVAGLKGTGSCDFSVSDLFVPEAFTFDSIAWEPKRGGPLYHLGLPGFVIDEHAGFALGVGRRALDEVIDLAKSKRRGYAKQVSLVDRHVFQRAVAEGDLRLRAARSLMLEVLERAWQTVCAGQSPEPRLQAEMRSAATFVTDVALDITSMAFRYGGGSTVWLNSILQRCLRDLYVGASHLMVNDSAYENYGQFLLELPDADPMG
ncbi:MAG: acyl-CoA dehydrogenase family protein [Candidatus Tectomicrobia bacterium]